MLCRWVLTKFWKCCAAFCGEDFPGRIPQRSVSLFKRRQYHLLETWANSHPPHDAVSQKTVKSSLPKAEIYFRVKNNYTHGNSPVYFNLYFGPFSNPPKRIFSVLSATIFH